MDTRLIEVAFPLKQASLDSLHEKNVRHGHISTLHIWPARRPLAASRAALLATLLPDPGTPEERKKLVERIGGKVVSKPKTKKLPGGRIEEKMAEETEGGVLHWGRETSPDLDWFREKIKEAHGGRVPRVLDPFSGGGAIPLEAMRLGCETTAVDINPVAWFVLKCTLEYPHKLAGQTRHLPGFARESKEFMEAFFKGTSKVTKKQLDRLLNSEQLRLFGPPEAGLSWHVKAWGWRVLQGVKHDLEGFYPLVEGKVPVAYLWARTVICKNCRATIPLLKTRWLCKKDNKRVLLQMEVNNDRSGVIFSISTGVPQTGGNAAQRRELDKKFGLGTMSRSGAQCPCCPAIMTKEDIRLEGKAGRLGSTLVAVVVEGASGKEYRLPTPEELDLDKQAQTELHSVFGATAFGCPSEPTPKGGSGASRAFSVDGYGFTAWAHLFTSRQLLALGTVMKHTKAALEELRTTGYPEEWAEAIYAYLAICLDRLADYNSNVCNWDSNGEYITHTFQRFALPIKWDFSEINPASGATGDYMGGLDWISRYISHATEALQGVPTPRVINRSATELNDEGFDLVITDPPYYDAIPYSDLMDFFYVWLRRTLYGLNAEMERVFGAPLGPKWDHEKGVGELIDDSSRFGGDKELSKKVYEEGMYQAFLAAHKALNADGRLVIVFAHKHPDAWESLVSATIRAGFVVDASWPIQTEMGNRTRAQASAALSSSVWLVCRKRPVTARPGWDNKVLDEMRERITTRLRDFWDAGVRGPDFVWAATGPALEAYSRHPVIKKANDLGKHMSVSEFLKNVRRLVVEFVVGRILEETGTGEANGLDDVTTYYLLHRKEFGLADVPAGACILYAVSCGLSDAALADQHDILIRSGGQAAEESDEDDETEDEGADAKEGSGSTVKLRPWHQRKRKSMGYDAEGKPAPLIDQIHRLMHLWKAGDVVKVDDYLDERGLRRNQLFHHLLQALIELADQGSEERALLESISNHVVSRGLPTGQEKFQI